MIFRIKSSSAVLYYLVYVLIHWYNFLFVPVNSYVSIIETDYDDRCSLIPQ